MWWSRAAWVNYVVYLVAFSCGCDDLVVAVCVGVLNVSLFLGTGILLILGCVISRCDGYMSVLVLVLMMILVVDMVWRVWLWCRPLKHEQQLY